MSKFKNTHYIIATYKYKNLDRCITIFKYEYTNDKIKAYIMK